MYTHQNLYDVAKAICRANFIALKYFFFFCNASGLQDLSCLPRDWIWQSQFKS